MDDPIIEAWVAEQLSLLRDLDRALVSQHIDEIGSSMSEEVRDVPAALQVLSVIHKLTRGEAPDLVVKLAFPLEDSPTLDTRVPDLDRLGFSWEPPSVYLFGPAQLSVLPDREEYRCVFEATQWGSGLVGEYACGRSMESRDLGWEFSRTLWFQVGAL